MSGSNLCVVQFDDRFGANEDSLGDQLHLANHVKRVCDDDENCRYYRFGSDYARAPAAQSRRPPYWDKVRAVADVMDHSQCKYTMWLDTDATLATTPTRVLHSLDEQLADRDMLISGDNQAAGWSSAFCAGVFAVKNSPSGHYLVNQWNDGWDEVRDRWKVDADGRWDCENCTWAGFQYEQGYFIDGLERQDNVAAANWCALQRGGHEDEPQRCENIEPLTYHFAGPFKANINSYLETYSAD